MLRGVPGPSGPPEVEGGRRSGLLGRGKGGPGWGPRVGASGWKVGVSQAWGVGWAGGI